MTNDDKKALVEKLNEKYSSLSAEQILASAINEDFAGKIALLSSFGSHSAVLIRQIAEINTATPVLFIDTLQHFDETLQYVDTLEKEFALTNLRRLKPDAEKIARIDPNGDLWKHQANRNEWIRKVEPLKKLLETGEFEAIISGRKSYQTSDRENLQPIELDEDGIFRINPLYSWSKDDIAADFAKHNLPPHPLVAKGYKSIGSKHSTAPVKEGEDERAGRWAHTKDEEGNQKQECGLWVASNELDLTEDLTQEGQK